MIGINYELFDIYIYIYIYIYTHTHSKSTIEEFCMNKKSKAN